MMKSIIEENEIPGYEVLKYYEWVPDFVRLSEIKENELPFLNRQIAFVLRYRNEEFLSEELRKELDAYFDNHANRSAELAVELDHLTPACFYLYKNGRIIGDIREAFIENWKVIQTERDFQCNPCGKALEDCSPNERLAYEIFEIGNYLHVEEKDV